MGFRVDGDPHDEGDRLCPGRHANESIIGSSPLLELPFFCHLLFLYPTHPISHPPCRGDRARWLARLQKPSSHRYYSTDLLLLAHTHITNGNPSFIRLDPDIFSSCMRMCMCMWVWPHPLVLLPASSRCATHTHTTPFSPLPHHKFHISTRTGMAIRSLSLYAG